MLDFDVGALGVVRRQGLTHDLEEVGQASVPQSVLNRDLAVPFTQLAFHDVGVGDPFSAPRRLRSDRLDHIGGGRIQILQIEFDPEFAQIKVMEFDWLRGDGEGLLFGVVCDLLEFLEQGQHVFIEIPESRNDAANRRGFRLPVEAFDPRFQGPDGSLKIVGQLANGCLPAAVTGLGELPKQRPAPLPLPYREVKRISR